MGRGLVFKWQEGIERELYGGYWEPMARGIEWKPWESGKVVVNRREAVQKREGNNVRHFRQAKEDKGET